MSLTVTLQNALSGMQAAQASLSVISSNISNAQTPGYSRETAPLTSEVLGGAGAGVTVGVPQRQVDDNLARSVRDQNTVSSAATTTDTYYQQIQSLFGQVNGGSSLNAVYANFTAALQTLATTPEDPVAQTSAVSAGQVLAQSLNNLSSGIQQVRANADSDLASSVTTLNQQLQNIATFNGEITRATALGESTAALQDQRDQALNQVAGLIGVQSFVRPDGSMVVLTTTGKTLVDSTAAQFSYTQAGTVTAGTPLSKLTVNGLDVTSEVTTGQIGALLNMRDTQLPNLTAELNQFTNGLYNATSASTLGTTDTSPGAGDANHFFSGVNTATGVDNAATIQVHPDLLANASLLDGTTASPDPSISQTLVANANAATSFSAAGNFQSGTSTTLTSYASQILGQTSSAAASATSNAQYQSTLQTSLAARASTVSGVNIDTELANLTVFQNMYAASAHVLTTVNNVFDILLKI